MIYSKKSKVLNGEVVGTGIIICGLNGAGKSTIGKVLAKELNFYFIDIEELYFPKTDPHYTYASPRTRKEVEQLLFREMNAHRDFVFASVKGNYGENICLFFQYAVFIDAPKDIRLQRVKERSFHKFGSRMLPGGDLYEQEEAFFRFVKSRAENTVKKWVQSLSCPVIRVDGTKPIEENVRFIMKRIRSC